VTSQKIDSILNVIKRPNNTFKEIYQNVDDYFKLSIIIFILSSFFTITLPITSQTSSELPTNELGYILDVEMQILDSM